jgi:IPT/TIG domain
VVLTGSGFTGTTAVNFGPNTAARFTVDSDNQITAVSPAGSGTVDITVTTPAGVTVPSQATTFTYS